MQHTKSFELRSGVMKIEFDREGGGFPSRLTMDGPDGPESWVAGREPWLTATLADGRTARPFWPEGTVPVRRRVEEAERLEFRNLPWRTADGEILPFFKLSLRYEFWPCGLAFVRSFFAVETSAPPALAGFHVAPPMTWPGNSEATWMYWRHPPKRSADLIQTIRAIHRGLKTGEDQHAPGTILPLVGFDFGPAGGWKNRHMEWFMEGFNSLGSDIENTATDVVWDGDRPKLAWNFLCEPRTSALRPWQWRNQWGWLFTRSPQSRRHPPLRMFHYVDKFQRYPTTRQVEKMVAEGANLLVLHETWRVDSQNGGCPWNEAEFQRLLADARRCNLRVAPYVRGNEISVREEQCDWFDEFLRRDFDGLYLDYGGPLHYGGADEIYPGGRIGFREHFLAMRALRERVGEGGVLLSHTGPFFSGEGLAGLADGYVAGEGEKGVMIRDRAAHAYYSGLTVAPSSLWTAAFPDYRSKKSVPFMAASGQIPHVTLGIQRRSSSLSHPREPGCVTYARPLWRLWSMLDGRAPVTVMTEFNAEGVFRTDGPETGVCLYRTKDGEHLLVATNFSASARRISVDVDWAKAGWPCPKSGTRMVKLDPEQDPPVAVECPINEGFSADLCGCGVTGWMFGMSGEAVRERLEAFRRPYPAPDAADQAWWAEMEALRERRFNPRVRTRAFLQLTISNPPSLHEESMYRDLFHNRHILYRVDAQGTRERLGELGMQGLTREPTPESDFIRPGGLTPWIPLHDYLPPGEHDLEIRAEHYGEDFYSFIEGWIAENPGDPGTADALAFANELDSDRARLTFTVRLR